MSVLAARAGMMMQRSAQDRRKKEMSSGVCSPEVFKKMAAIEPGGSIAAKFVCHEPCPF